MITTAQRIRLGAVGLVAFIVLAYANSLRTPFLFDDVGAVLKNPTIRQLASWAVLHPPGDGSATTNRPIVNLSLAINYVISGENPWSYHLLNVAIHAAAALVLFGIVRRTIARATPDASSSQPTTIAFFAALLWAVHPLQTESVTCIAQRTESLAGLAYLFTLYAFLRGSEPRASAANRWLAASVVACLLGMATKEMMVTAPLVVLLSDRTFLAGGWRAALSQRRGYYVTLGATWLLLAALVAGGASARLGLAVSSWAYLLKQAQAVLLYLQLSVWPHPLVLDYGTAVAGSVGEVGWQALVVLALLGATLWALWRRSLLGFAGAAFFLLLSPSSSVVPLAQQTMAEHRMYLPLAALVCAGVVGCLRCGRRAGHAALTLACIAGALTTRARNADYRDEITIWRDTVAKAPGSARAQANLGWALAQHDRLDAAEPHFARAVALAPHYFAPRYFWGMALLERGHAPEALPHLEAAVRLMPLHADARIGLANALVRAGRAAEAIPHYEEVLRRAPAADAHFNFAVALVEAGRTAEARAQFRQALSRDPQLAGAHAQLARLSEQSGDVADAEAHWREAVRLAPNDAPARLRLGTLYARQEKLALAAEQLAIAVRLAPGDADAHGTFGNVLMLQGRPADALRAYETALRLRPNDARTRQNMELAREALR